MSNDEESKMTLVAPDLDPDLDPNPHEALDGDEDGEEAMNAGMPSQFEGLFAMLDSLPETNRWRAESLDGETIILSPTPTGLHQENVYQLTEQLRPHVPEDHRIEPYLEIRAPHLGRSVIPDLFVAPRDVLLTHRHSISPYDVLLVAEVASQRQAKRDREEKRRVYAKMAIELYMCVDPAARQTILFTNPKDEDYLDTIILHFGAKMEIPDPFGFTLDTGAFRAY